MKIISRIDVTAGRATTTLTYWGSTALDAFYLEHRRCGELDAGVKDDRVWMTCTCGARGTAMSEKAVTFGMPGSVVFDMDMQGGPLPPGVHPRRT